MGQKEPRSILYVRKLLKKLANKVAPGLLGSIGRIEQIDTQLKNVQNDLARLATLFESRDSHLEQLKSLANEVEPYQPTYGITGIISNPSRNSNERARAIEDYIKPVAGQRILDIGSSLGYFSFYFADRGATVEGWDNNPQNVEVARRIGEMNGINVNFKTKEFNLETATTIPDGQFDIVLVLSVFHHIIYQNGLDYTQRLVKELVSHVPVLIVELAKKGENQKLPWNKAQPKDELSIFDLVRDQVSIKKIADFHNHLSKKTRPMYVIENKKQVRINSHRYNYTRVSKQAYKDSPVAYSAIGRRYYFGTNFVIKEYSLDPISQRDNLSQILNGTKLLFTIRERKLKVFHAPKLLDFQIDYPKKASLVIGRVNGQLISDLTTPMKSRATISITKDILRTLIDLEKLGLHHNDLRSWNVIVDQSGRGWLIDYGLVDSIASDDDIVALIWVVYTLLTNEREMPTTKFRTFPPRTVFTSSPKLLELYDRVKSGERSPTKLYKLL